VSSLCDVVKIYSVAIVTTILILLQRYFIMWCTQEQCHNHTKTNYFHKNKLQHNDIPDVIICTATSSLGQIIRGIILRYYFVTCYVLKLFNTGFENVEILSYLHVGTSRNVLLCYSNLSLILFIYITLLQYNRKKFTTMMPDIRQTNFNLNWSGRDVIMTSRGIKLTSMFKLLSKNLKSMEIDDVIVTIWRHKNSKYCLWDTVSLSNILVLCILKYRIIKPLKIPHKYGSTSQIFLHCLRQKRL